MLDTDIKFHKYHYYWCRLTAFKENNILHWDTIQEHNHDDNRLEDTVQNAESQGLIAMIPWARSQTEYGLDIMSSSRDRLAAIIAGFALSLTFDATFNKYYPIWQQKLEVDRREASDSLD